MLSRRTVTWGALALVAAALVVYASREALGPRIPVLLAAIRDAGPLGPVLFVGAFVLASVVALPVSVLVVAAGAIFGLVPGVTVAMAGALLGATACFVLARGVLRAAVDRRVGRDPRVAAIDRAVGDRGLLIVLLLRLSPVFPFGPLNYVLGLTRVRYRDFLAGSLGILPSVFMYASAGTAAGEVVAIASGARPARGPGAYALLAVGLVATIAVTVYVTRVARRALHDAHLDA